MRVVYNRKNETTNSVLNREKCLFSWFFNSNLESNRYEKQFKQPVIWSFFISNTKSE